MSGYMLLGHALGPALPFLGGSAFGFVGGLVHRYRNDLDEARLMLARYPRVMEYHVGQVEPGALRGRSWAEWTAGLDGCARRQGVLIAALYSAADAIGRLQEEEEERILQDGGRGGDSGAAAE